MSFKIVDLNIIIGILEKHWILALKAKVTRHSFRSNATRYICANGTFTGIFEFS